jgi:NAD(P) transhydrogenase subunit beta
VSWTLPEVLMLVVKASYLVAATLFLLGLQRMASPLTARSGIRWAGLGMVIATVATLFLPGLHNLGLIVAAAVIGIALTWFWGKKVAITDMPQMVALFNGMGGGSAAAIGAVELLRFALAGAQPPRLTLVLGHADTPLEKAIGFVAVLLGAGNAAGGYVVTERMLEMFKTSRKPGGDA